MFNGSVDQRPHTSHSTSEHRHPVLFWGEHLLHTLLPWLHQWTHTSQNSSGNAVFMKHTVSLFFFFISASVLLSSFSLFLTVSHFCFILLLSRLSLFLFLPFFNSCICLKYTIHIQTVSPLSQSLSGYVRFVALWNLWFVTFQGQSQWSTVILAWAVSGWLVFA